MADDIDITILVDNQACAGLTGEHGFATWIKVAGRSILFDTGQAALEANAAALGCDLSRLDALILSHGHYDHGGALAKVLAQAPGASLYCHPRAFIPRFSVKPGEPPRLIAVPEADRDVVANLPSWRVRPVDGPCELAPGMFLSGPIPRRHPLEDTGGPFYLDPAGRQPDPLDDDLALWIETREGFTVLTGCCHAGLINAVEHIRAVSGIDRVRGIVGGLHLLNASEARLAATCAALRDWAPEFVVPCHCTGEGAVARLQAEFGGMIMAGYAGFNLKLSME